MTRVRRPFAFALILLLAAGPTALAGAQDRSGQFGTASVDVIPGTAPITIPRQGQAAPYPSTIEVSGVAGGVADLNVVLRGFGHNSPQDVDVLLVGPRGQTAVVMSDVGVGVDVTNLTLALDDQADASLPTNAGLTSGRFKPTNFDASDQFPDAPSQNRGAALSVFEGTNPNGAWRLFVVDDDPFAPDVGGAFDGGWSLEIAHGGGGAPRARDDAYSVKEDVTLRRAAPGVLANDFDPDDGPLTAAVATPPTKGTLTLRLNGAFVYKPRRNANGLDRFTYEIEDAQGFTATRVLAGTQRPRCCLLPETATRAWKRKAAPVTGSNACDTGTAHVAAVSLLAERAPLGTSTRPAGI